MHLPLFLLLAANVTSPQIVPQVFISAVNAASLDSPVSPGAIVSIFFSGTLTPPFPPAERISIALDPARGSRMAVPNFVRVSDRQLNAVLPPDVPNGRATLNVLRGDEEFLASTIDITPSAPAIFIASREGTGPAATTPVNRLTTAFTPGSDITLWATGLGATIPSDVSVDIGGQPALVTYAGHHSIPGLDQINIRLPAGTAFGCYVPVTIHAAGATSKIVTLSINDSAASCPHPLGLTYSELQTLDNGGQVVAGALRITNNFQVEWNSNARLELYGRGATDTYLLSQPQRPYSLTPTCTSYGGAAAWISGRIVQPIDAGARTILNGPANKRLDLEGYPPFYSGFAESPAGPFFTQGSWLLSIPGGKDLPVSELPFRLPPPIRWTSKAANAVIQSGQALRVTWDASGHDGTEEMTVRLARIPGGVQCTTYAWRGEITLPASLIGVDRTGMGYLTLLLTPNNQARPVIRLPLTDGNNAYVVPTYSFSEVLAVSIR